MRGHIGGKTFHGLIVWQKAIALTRQVYAASRTMPSSEKFGLIAQMRRSAVSIPSNIAEGNARQSMPDYLRFLMMARGSLAELETQVIIARELRMLAETESILSAIHEVRRILQGLITSLRKKQVPQNPPSRKDCPRTDTHSSRSIRRT